MLDAYEELLTISHEMDKLHKCYQSNKVQRPLAEWRDAAETIGRAWGGSWLGYHSNVYYQGLQPAPLGTHFSQEWGFIPAIQHGSVGDWVEYDPESIVKAIHDLAGNPNLDRLTDLYGTTFKTFLSHQTTAISVLEISLRDFDDPFLTRMKDQVASLEIMTIDQEARRGMPQGDIISRDRIAMSQGLQVPQHLIVLARARVFNQMVHLVADLASLTRQSAEHISRLRRSQHIEESEGVNGKVFIGHGHSPAWLELERFLRDRLKLEVDEFNRVSPAGMSNKERLSEMMDDAGFAFLVMTGEDEKAEGNPLPRMNVVHEAGLFQGRLGFERAIVLLEEGCEEFSNIAGLGQVRFPEGNIAATFEEVRTVLKREGMLSTPQSGESG